MMNEFEAYTNYLALKLHFTSTSYDYFKYNGKVSASNISFQKRKDRYQFIKLSKKLSDNQIIDYYVANFIHNKLWIGDFRQRIWADHKRVNQSLEYVFKNDVEKLLTTAENFDILFNCDKGNHPKLLRAYLGKKICLETLVIFDIILNYRKRFDNEISETFIWPKISRLIIKYTPFVKIDNNTFKEIILKEIHNG